MMKGGRPKDLVWDLFEEANDMSKVKCKVCSVLVCSKADRLRKHLSKCPVDQNSSMYWPTGMSKGPISSQYEEPHDKTMVKCKCCHLFIPSKILRTHCKKCPPVSSMSGPYGDKTGSLQVSGDVPAPDQWKSYLKCSPDSSDSVNISGQSVILNNGRPKDPIWDHFEESNDKGKVKCKKCSMLVSSKADRLRNHSKKCFSYSKDTISIGDRTVYLPTSGKRPVPDDFTKPPPSKRVQLGLVNHKVSPPVLTKEDIDQSVAEFVFGCNLPFSVVDHPLFLTMVESLRPGYRPPSRESLSLLDHSHKKYKSTMKAKLQDKAYNEETKDCHVWTLNGTSNGAFSNNAHESTCETTNDFPDLNRTSRQDISKEELDPEEETIIKVEETVCSDFCTPHL